jgi:hypothetical protein
MVLRALENLKSSIVVLPAKDANIEISTVELSQVVRNPSSAQLGDIMQFSSLKDQTAIVLAGGKVDFQDQSGEEPTRHRLPEIVHGFLNILRRQGLDAYRAYGFNFEVTFDCRDYQTAAESISDQYVNFKALQDRAGIDVRGAGVKLFFDHSESHCRLVIEPRLQDVSTPVVFASVNYHYDLDGADVPSLDDLSIKYHGQWTHFRELLEKLMG